MKKGSFDKLIHMIYENINRRKITFQEFEDLLNTAIVFDQSSIITEDKNLLIDVSEDLIKYCLNHLNEEIDINQFKDLMKDSRHYSNIKNISKGNIFISIFNFNINTEIKEFILKRFDVEEKDLKKEIILFKERFSDKNGMCLYDKDYNECVCCINIAYKHIYETIYHELSHIIQKMCNIRITSSTQYNKNLAFKNITKLKQDLKINDEIVSYLFDRNEYCNHVDDLILSLVKVYKQFYTNISPFNFYYHIVLSSIQKTSSDKFLNCDFMNKYKQVYDNDIEPIIMFYISYYLDLKYHKIKQVVWKSLNKMLKDNN